MVIDFDNLAEERVSPLNVNSLNPELNSGSRLSDDKKPSLPAPFQVRENPETQPAKDTGQDLSEF